MSSALPLTIVAPGPVGGGWHEMACDMSRILAAGVTPACEVTTVPGRGGTVGLAAFVAEHSADPGKLLVSGNVMIGAAVGHGTPVTLAQTKPLARLTGEWEAMAVAETSAIRDIENLAERIRRDGAALRWAVASVGSVGQVTVGLIYQALGVDPASAVFSHHADGASAARAVAAGEADVAVNGYRELIHTAGLTIIAAASPQRLAALPAPTLAEAGIDVSTMNWRMVCTGGSVTPAQAAHLVDVIEQMASSPEWTRRLAEQGLDNCYLSGPALDLFIAEETRRTIEVLRQMGIPKG